MDTPIIYFFFNRPEKVLSSFKSIANVKPKKLFLVSDGPRKNNTADQRNIDICKSIISETIDWDCCAKWITSQVNLGCGERVSSGISEVFKTEIEAIIIEDDCVAAPEFFEFASTALEKFRNSPTIFQVNGWSLNDTPSLSKPYMSAIPEMWGWATWARAWKLYRRTFSTHLSLSEQCRFFKNAITKNGAEYFWSRVDLSASGALDTWDYQWLYIILSQNGKSIAPPQNLIQNIGFGIDATHTKGKSSFAIPLLSKVSFSNNYDVNDIKENPNLDLIHWKARYNIPTKGYIRLWIRRLLRTFMYYINSFNNNAPESQL